LAHGFLLTDPSHIDLVGVRQMEFDSVQSGFHERRGLMAQLLSGANPCAIAVALLMLITSPL